MRDERYKSRELAPHFSPLMTLDHPCTKCSLVSLKLPKVTLEAISAVFVGVSLPCKGAI
jgi:hypothetical protein